MRSADALDLITMLPLMAAERPQSALETECDAELQRRRADVLGDLRIAGHRFGRRPQLDLRLEREPAVLVAKLLLAPCEP